MNTTPEANTGNYFKAIQDEQASQLKKEKKELEQLSTILDYNFEHSEDQMENAKARLFQIEDDSIVRQHSKFLANDCVTKLVTQSP